jgi:hypothetical protein
LSNEIDTLDLLIELAKSSDLEPIDFGMIKVDEELVYKIIAKATIEGFNKTNEQTKDIVYLASVINLHVKNFVLTQEKIELLTTINSLTSQISKLKKSKG